MMDLHKLIDEIGLGRYHQLLFLFVGTFFAVDNSVLITAASITIALEEDWKLGTTWKAALVSVVFLGSAVGSVFSGSFSDVHGRRPMILLSLFCELAFGFACSMTSGPEWMLVFRFLFGVSLGIGMAPALSMLVECSPSRWRGHMVNGVTGLMCGLGIMYACVVILIYMPALDGGTKPQAWRYVTALAVVPCAIVFPFVCLLMLESPHFLAGRGRHQDALAVLRFMAFMNERPEVIALIEEEARLLELDGHGPPCETTPLAQTWSLATGSHNPTQSQGALDDSEKAVHFTKEERAASEEGFFHMWNMVRVSEFYPVMLGGMFMYFLVNSTVNGLNYGLPQILATMHGDISPAVSLCIVGVGDFLALVLACALVEAPGISYRDAMKGLCMGAFVSITFVASFDYGAPRLGLFAAFMSKLLTVALFQMVFAYFGEVFPSSIRCTANSYCMAAGRMGAVIGPINFEILSARVPSNHLVAGPHVFFFGVLSVLCLAGVYVIQSRLTVEIKGMPLQDFHEDVTKISNSATPFVGSRAASKTYGLSGTYSGAYTAGCSSDPTPSPTKAPVSRRHSRQAMQEDEETQLLVPARGG